MPLRVQEDFRVTASNDGRVKRQEWLGLALFLTACFVGLMLVACSPAKYHGDERFYTDAAVQMIQNGDYWTPHYADGSIRLLKPILTYWAVVGSFKIFGISLFASRLPFLVAGLLLVLLTRQLAQTILKSHTTALLAVLILASNEQLMTLSTRATPDVLVCVFLLMSMWGFARIWFAADESFWGPFLAFAGIGLAVQTKGVLGLCPLLSNLFFWLIARPDAKRLKLLADWRALILGAAIAVFWYVVMFWTHGTGALRDFFDDQMGSKMSTNPGFILGNFTTYLFAGFRHFLPWTLLLLGGLVCARTELMAFWRDNRAQCLFLMSLFVVLAVAFSLGNVRRTRYLITGYPLLAVGLAGAINSYSLRGDFFRWVRWLIFGCAALLALTGAVLGWVGCQVDWRLVAGGVLVAIAGIAAFYVGRVAQPVRLWFWLAGTSAVLFIVLGACVRPVFSPSPLPGLTRMLMRDHKPGGFVYSWKISNSAAAQIRLLSAGTLHVKALAAIEDGRNTAAPLPVVTTAEHRTALEDAHYKLLRADAGSTSPELERFVARLPSGFAFGNRSDPGKEYWIAVRP